MNGGEFLPLAYMSDKLTLGANERGEYVLYHTDEHGFNNPKGLWKAEEIEVVAIGDSFTIGTNVLADENMIGNIREKNTFNT